MMEMAPGVGKCSTGAGNGSRWGKWYLRWRNDTWVRDDTWVGEIPAGGVMALGEIKCFV